MINIAVFGGSQGVGKSVVEQALAQGHRVTVLARTPNKIAITHPQLTVVSGDVLDSEAVARVVEGQQVVINSLGGTANNPIDICTRGTKQIIQAMNKYGVRRLITVTALGVGDSYDQVPFFFKGIIATILRKAYADKNTQEPLIMTADLDWIIIRPGGLSDKPATGVYRFGTDKSISGGPSISRADVADFVLKQLEDNRYLRRAVAVSG